MTAAAAVAAVPLRPAVRWALLFGNFVTGCGLMVVVGTLNDITRSLQVSVSLGGQLVSIAAATVCLGAPLLAGWVAFFGGGVARSMSDDARIHNLRQARYSARPKSDA